MPCRSVSFGGPSGSLWPEAISCTCSAPFEARSAPAPTSTVIDRGRFLARRITSLPPYSSSQFSIGAFPHDFYPFPPFCNAARDFLALAQPLLWGIPETQAHALEN